jgi:uncharacterized protein (DUF488 family)
MSDKTSTLFYSIGHGNRSIEEFVNLLLNFQVKNLADVRSYPSSTRNPHFNKENLENSLGKVGISYTWLPDLGGFRRSGLGGDSPHVALKSSGFRNYADYMATESFQKAADKLSLLAHTGATCFMCAEALPQRCHRSLLADYLSMMGMEIMHILDNQYPKKHQLSPLATVSENRLLYNRRETTQLELHQHD